MVKQKLERESNLPTVTQQGSGRTGFKPRQSMCLTNRLHCTDMATGFHQDPSTLLSALVVAYCKHLWLPQGSVSGCRSKRSPWAEQTENIGELIPLGAVSNQQWKGAHRQYLSLLSFDWKIPRHAFHADSQSSPTGVNLSSPQGQ